MKLPISWLSDWIELDATPTRVADVLTQRGFYVESIERHGRSYPGIVVARVLEVRKHPNADKLTLCRVDGGQGELSIVCGAPNVRADMIVPLATEGARLPGGLTIKRSKIRGEESQGMLCSARELELSNDHEGILDLATFRPGVTLPSPGTPFDTLMPPPDAVLEIETPFNRPDGLGVVGLAREVRAALDSRWTSWARERLDRRWSGGKGFDLELEDPEGCPRYIAQAIEDIDVKPSPEGWARKLEALGQRPINNIVDATNLVLFELGQPLHAFDLDRLQGPAIRVRRAHAGESLTTLDSKPRTLDPEVLVIADAARPVAIAGVMGGADTEVTPETRRLLLECAWFEPRRVRRGSRLLGITTEASKRFERGVDPEVGAVATARFLELLRESCPKLSLGAARERVATKDKPRQIPVRTSRIERVAGLAITAADAARHLESLEFGVKTGDPLRVTVPSWRVDVTLEDDLVEEVARSVGYDAIPEARLETGGSYAVRSPSERLLTHARRAMLARGLDEAWCTTLVSEREAAQAAPLLGDSIEALVRLRNPMSRESEVLRPNLVPGLLRACAHNLRQGRTAVRLFEVGAGFLADAKLPRETLMLAAIVTGPRFKHAHTEAQVSAKDSAQQPMDFFAAKGLWEAWLEDLRVDSPEWRAYSGPGWKPGASAEVASGTSRIGWAGTLSPSLLREWEIEAPVQLFVAMLDPIQSARRKSSIHLPGRFPPVRRDLAFFVPQTVTHMALEQTLIRAAGERLDSIELFDVYTGPGTPEGMKSMAYALQYQHPERTMTEPEVQTIQDRIVSAVGKELGGRLRER
jgi:phenylalanyl-tRNA synthetase beta chain